MSKSVTSKLIAVTLWCLISPSFLIAQQGRPESPASQQQPSQREPTGTTQNVDENSVGQWRVTPIVRMPAMSSIGPSPSSLETVRQSLLELRKLTARLREALTPGASVDSETLTTNSVLIQRTVRCLQSVAGLGPTVPNDQAPKETFDGDVRQLVAAISDSVEELAHSPVTRQTKVLDARLISEAAVMLEKILALSGELRSRADALNKQVGPGRSLNGSNRAKQNYRRPERLYLSADCGVWSPDVFSPQTARSKRYDSFKLEGVTIQLNQHKINEHHLTSIENCLTCSIDEKATAEGEQYAFLLKELYSYEVKGKRFAYSAHYQIVRTRNHKIRFRVFEPVILFFVDREGQGEFRLMETGSPLRPLPLWVKEMFPKS